MSNQTNQTVPPIRQPWVCPGCQRGVRGDLETCPACRGSTGGGGVPFDNVPWWPASPLVPVVPTWPPVTPTVTWRT